MSWIVGLVLGALDAVLLLEFPILGLALVVIAVIVTWQAGHGLAGLAGILTGVGSGWLLLFGRVKLTCVDTATSTCVAPSIDQALIASAGVLIVGLIATGVAARSARRA